MRLKIEIYNLKNSSSHLCLTCFVLSIFYLQEKKKNNGVTASRPQVWMAAYMKDGTSNSDLVNEVMVCDTTLLYF